MHIIPQESSGFNGPPVNDPAQYEAKKKRLEGMTATRSLLSEGEVFCDECGGRIDAAAIYVTKKRPGYAPAHTLEIVALLHPGCYEREVA